MFPGKKVRKGAFADFNHSNLKLTCFKRYEEHDLRVCARLQAFPPAFGIIKLRN